MLSWKTPPSLHCNDFLSRTTHGTEKWINKAKNPTWNSITIGTLTVWVKPFKIIQLKIIQNSPGLSIPPEKSNLSLWLLLSHQRSDMITVSGKNNGRSYSQHRRCHTKMIFFFNFFSCITVSKMGLNVT